MTFLRVISVQLNRGTDTIAEEFTMQQLLFYFIKVMGSS
ncbi:MAG: hypothetical protein JWM44_4514 [Bacilli bacterium]|nr:hypothetical protein [Bacilli bacterium]